MEKAKIKLEDLKVKSFVTTSNSEVNSKAKNNDGGYTWVG
jgi:hypothetical protein